MLFSLSSLHQVLIARKSHLLCILSISLITANYTVKTLDTGGFEIEFPNEEFVAKLREVYEQVHPDSQWQEYSYRNVTKLSLEKGKSVTIQIGSSHYGSNGRKIWIYDDPGCKMWFNGEFKDLYLTTYEAINNIEERK